MKAAVVCDDYKLKNFRKNLKFAGYEWTEHPGPIKGSTTLQVMTDDMNALHMVIRTCDAQAKRKKR